MMNLLGYYLQDLQQILDNGHRLPSPDGILINGLGSGATFNVEQGQYPTLDLYIRMWKCPKYFIMTVPTVR